jgi:hypothetical protein
MAPNLKKRGVAHAQETRSETSVRQQQQQQQQQQQPQQQQQRSQGLSGFGGHVDASLCHFLSSGQTSNV